METKLCLVCNQTKPLNEFYRQYVSKAGKEYYENRCKSCSSKYYKARHRGAVEEMKQFSVKGRQKGQAVETFKYESRPFKLPEAVKVLQSVRLSEANFEGVRFHDEDE